MPDNGKTIIARYDRQRNDAAQHFNRCDRQAPFIAPSRGGINSRRTPGVDQMDGVYDSTTIFAADLLSKYIAGEVINPAQRWHNWKLRKAAGAPERTEGDEWVEECNKIALDARAQSNFYAETPEMLVDYAGFGTGCIMGDERKSYREDRGAKKGFRGVRYQTTKTGRFVLSEDEEGAVNGCSREYTVSAAAAAARWGKDFLPKEMQAALAGDGKGEPDKMFRIVHAVYPRDMGERGEYKGAKGYAYASCWVEYDSKQTISEGGYRRFPFMVPRWEKTPGEIFGRGPGDRAFPDTRTLNKAKQMGLEDWALKIRPPIIVAHDSVIGNIRLRPGAPTTIRASGGRAVNDLMQPFETGSHPEVSQIKEEELRKSIRQLFFVDQILQMLQVEKSEMTAEEWRDKFNLVYKILGSVYGRLQSEFLIPETELVWSLMYDAGAFPPPPPDLAQDGDVVIDVEFVNPIAMQQEMTDVGAILKTWNAIGIIGLNDPNEVQKIKQNFDANIAIRTLAERYGIPKKILRTVEDRDKFLEAMAQKTAQDNQMAQLAATSQMGKNVAPLIGALNQQQAA